MDCAPSAEITRLLRAWEGGDRGALDQLTPIVYAELHQMARRQMAGENAGNSLQPTALVNEAYLRLVEGADVHWHDRAHFFAVSATTMRRILVDAARARGAEKRGGGVVKVDLNESIDGVVDRDAELIALDEALEGLAQFDARKAQVVELRFFGGLSVEETAKVLRVSEPTVLRDWKLARAWLMREMGAG
jgi:RNA polymerase sigma factor (TIGR02999 family)